MNHQKYGKSIVQEMLDGIRALPLTASATEWDSMVESARRRLLDARHVRIESDLGDDDIALILGIGPRPLH